MQSPSAPRTGVSFSTSNLTNFTEKRERRYGGTRPTEFEADRQRLIQLMRRFSAADAKYGTHPALGTLTRDEWLIWGYRHTDHHLRQFAL